MKHVSPPVRDPRPATPPRVAAAGVVGWAAAIGAHAAIFVMMVAGFGGAPPDPSANGDRNPAIEVSLVDDGPQGDDVLPQSAAAEEVKPVPGQPSEAPPDREPPQPPPEPPAQQAAEAQPPSPPPVPPVAEPPPRVAEVPPPPPPPPADLALRNEPPPPEQSPPPTEDQPPPPPEQPPPAPTPRPAPRAEARPPAEQRPEARPPRPQPAQPAAVEGRGVRPRQGDQEQSYYAMISRHVAGFRRYPAAARARGITGRAHVRFQLAPDGRVMAVALVGTSGDPDLDSEGVELIRRASPFPAFPPGFAASPQVFDLRVNFQLDR